MTKSDNEWVPELGEWCEGTSESGTLFKCRILGVFQGPYPEAKCIVFQYEDGGIEAATEGNSYTFSQIKTEAEKRRENQIEAIYQALSFAGDWYRNPRTVADYLFRSGCRFPRQLTLDDYERLYQTTNSSAELVGAIDKHIRGEGL
jgi:hypothetical protein